MSARSDACKSAPFGPVGASPRFTARAIWFRFRPIAPTSATEHLNAASFDENLSSRLVGALADQFPDSSHVNLVGLASATDQEIWAEISPEESLLVLS